MLYSQQKIVWKLNIYALMLVNIFVNLLKQIRINYFQYELKVGTYGILAVLRFFKNNSGLKFVQLLEMIGVEIFGKIAKYNIIYLILSLTYQMRIQIYTQATNMSQLVTIENIYWNAAWLEREIWDLFGIVFYGNKNLKRILTDYGFYGHPLKKNFALTGEYSVNFNYNINTISMDVDSLSQEFRLLTTNNLVGVSRIQYNYIANNKIQFFKKNLGLEVSNGGVSLFFLSGIINQISYLEINNLITFNFYKQLGQFSRILHLSFERKKYKWC